MRASGISMYISITLKAMWRDVKRAIITMPSFTTIKISHAIPVCTGPAMKPSNDIPAEVRSKCFS